LIHVKHSFTDTEIPEDHVQKILHIDATGDPAKGVRCPAEVLGPELGGQMIRIHRCSQTGQTFLERMPVP
jgi:hypothetical protein